MRNYKIRGVALSLVFCGMSVICFAQTDAIATIKAGECDVYCALSNLLKSPKYEKQIEYVGRQQAYFVKFSVDVNGQVHDIMCNVNYNKLIVDFVTEAILSTNGKWIPAKHNGDPIEGTPFLLPIVFNVNGVASKEKENFVDSIVDIIKFNSTSTVTASTFIILSPFYYVMYH